MHTPTIPLGAQPSDYRSQIRSDVAPTLSTPARRVLDVGCGSGANEHLLRARGASRLVGIEIDPIAAATAGRAYDRVIVGDALEAVQQLQGEQFETIIIWDVLEHLYDPAELLSGLAAVSAPDVQLSVSVPNARNVLLFRDLLLRGTFNYAEHGHRDASHIRWFTRRDISALLAETGWHVTHTSTHALKPGRHAINRLTGGRAAEFFAVQWFLIARR